MALSYETKLTAVGAGSPTTTDANVAGATQCETDTSTALQTAEGELATLDAAIEITSAAVTALGDRIDRADAQITELEALVTSNAASTDGTSTGTLNIALQERVDALAAYTASDGEWGAADTALTAANLAIVVGDETTGKAFEDDGVTVSATDVPDTSMWKLRWDMQQTWTTKQGEATDAETALTNAITGDSLETLRGLVVSTTSDWTTQNDTLTGLVSDLVQADEDLTEAKNALADAVLACQIAAYNTYRETLEGEMDTRLEDLKTIKQLLES